MKPKRRERDERVAMRQSDLDGFLMGALRARVEDWAVERRRKIVNKLDPTAVEKITSLCHMEYGLDEVEPGEPPDSAEYEITLTDTCWTWNVQIREVGTEGRKHFVWDPFTKVFCSGTSAPEARHILKRLLLEAAKGHNPICVVNDDALFCEV